MDAVILGIVLPLAMIAGVLWLMKFAYDAGVRETEGRWSEIVSKANYQRELARRNEQIAGKDER